MDPEPFQSVRSDQHFHPHTDPACPSPCPHPSHPASQEDQGDRAIDGFRSKELEVDDGTFYNLDLCGIEAPPVLQGRSFRPLMQGGDYEARTSAYCEYKRPFAAAWKSVRTHTHKYRTSDDGTELLYDLATDPGELENLTAHTEYESVLNVMRHELIRRWFTIENQYPLRTGAY